MNPLERDMGECLRIALMTDPAEAREYAERTRASVDTALSTMGPGTAGIMLLAADTAEAFAGFVARAHEIATEHGTIQ